ncbi:hypothetical protein BDV96DRAFT_497328 [Lophiotrema nucula]|uniref:Oxidoreductase n=1 Tax=Lophiotrema nucula TaxID=690887 RepID=A0A6A5Z033_9PLEO|nr:hypothetical protein BDV96DRAFT_497328 [Lophiotrema nucula]
MAAKKTPGIALITGAASGIGKDTGIAFAESGALRVIFADLNEPGANEAAFESKKYATNLQYEGRALKVDVTIEEDVQRMVDMVVHDHGRIDYFVHSAGIGPDSAKPISDLSLNEFDKVGNVNLKGTLLCNRAVLKAMGAQSTSTYEGRNGSRDIGRGSIVNVGSLNSLGPLPGKLPYTAAKHGVTAITKTAALESSKLGIRVNMVCPSWVASPMTDAEREMNPHLEGLIKIAVPCGRMATTDEVSDTITFLCSPAASYITGQAIVIDDGLSLTVRLA